MDLPREFSHRPLTLRDAPAVHALTAADDLDQLGRVVVDLTEIVADWQRPSFDVGRSTVGIFDGDRLVAYAEQAGPNRGNAAVAPDYRDRGLWRPLAEWMQATARARGVTTVGVSVAAGGSSDSALDELGFRVRWRSWVLQLPEDAQIPQRSLPEGYAVREATPTDYVELHGVLEDAFLEWSGRDREPMGDFLARTAYRAGFEPWMIQVVADVGGTVVAGACLSLTEAKEVFVDRLATRADQRRRGFAQVLLADCFEIARTYSAQTCGLATDSRTGALGLYEKVGMVVLATWVNRAIDV